MKPLKLKTYSDSGHGWIAVKVKVLEELNIARKISACSYLSSTGATAYLEEDMDAGQLINALKAHNVPYILLDVSRAKSGRSGIRNYARYLSI